MKKLYIVIILFSFTCFSQTELEKQKISSTYNVKKHISFLNKVQKIDFEKNNRINEFLLQNPSFKKEFSLEGVKYSIVDVINGKPVYQSTDNANSAKAIKVNRLYSGGSLGLSLSGNGMTVGVWDGGWVLGTHDEFMVGGMSKVLYPDTANSAPPSEFHATHVAGTVAAQGVVSSAKGMAPEANLLSFDWTNDVTEAINQAFSNALLISNHSYGVPVLDGGGNLNVPNWYMGCYNDTAQTWDQLVYNYPYYLPVMSAGNSGLDSYSGGLATGYDKLTGNKNAKNSLIIANADPSVHPITGELTSLTINPSSSQGPTDDGRIKPDVAADGTSVFSCIDDTNNSYGNSTGTSMASPSAAGALLLLQEHYNNLFSSYMKASTLKGLVCHTAMDDSTIIGPDPKFGWGLINVEEAAVTITNSSVANPLTVIDELTISQGGVYEIQVQVDNPANLKATICWTDVPGTDMSGVLNSSTPALVNDLDLRIVKGAEINYPWKLQLSDVTAPAIKGDNNVDNVEKVEVENAMGLYTIVVSHKGLLTDSLQNYSLIISGFDSISTLFNDNFQNSKVNYNIYPNPTNDFLFIESAEVIKNYEVYDLEGRLIFQETMVDKNKIKLDLKKWNDGIYLIKIANESGYFTKKIIKK